MHVCGLFYYFDVFFVTLEVEVVLRSGLDGSWMMLCFVEAVEVVYPPSSQHLSVCFYRPRFITPNHLEKKQGNDTLVNYRGEERGSRVD